jgi:asparagine synthase (glutamine-hydrolysing)
LTRLLDRMRNRGPDSAGQWVDHAQGVALGNRRLAILDLDSRANQPMADPETGTRITFNGAIYNYPALRAELEARGHVFRTTSDTEVLLQGYLAYGPQIVHRLRGMYAFAIWDPSNQGMFLARDPFGIKPLYYVDDGERFVAASQVKALLQLDAAPRDIDPAAEVSFLLLGYVVEPHTLYRHIRAVPAGSSLWVDAKGVRPPAQFWSPSAALRDGEARRAEMSPHRLTEAAKRESLKESLTDSMRHHMVSDVPVGLFLSGGLDSATIAGLIAENNSGELQAHTLGLDELRDGPNDEVPFAQEIAAYYGLQQQSHWMGREAFAKQRAALIEAMDQPSVDLANLYFISKFAAGSGLKIALSGVGGDELFGGYPSYRQIPRAVGLLAPFAPFKGMAKCVRRFSAPLLSKVTSPKYASLLEYGTTVEDAYLLRRGLFLPWEIPAILGRKRAREGWEALDINAKLRGVTQGIEGRRAQVAALEMTMYMRNQLLRDADWAGMAHSLEVRTPLVDCVLLGQIAPLVVGPSPASKQDMASTVRQTVPADILSRPKSGFCVPIQDWLQAGHVGDPHHRERGLRGWAKYVLAAERGGTA